MSRVHQGQSPSYQRKIIVRETRTFDRLMFRCAKFFHDLHYNIEPEGSGRTSEQGKQGQGSGHSQQDMSFLDRAFIRRWKTKIYKYLEQEEHITLSNFGNFSEEKIFNMAKQRFKNNDKK